MKAHRLGRAAALSFVFVVGISSALEGVCDSNICDECSLYLAPSTIPNAGLGIFTTKPLEAGTVVGNGDVSYFN